MCVFDLIWTKPTYILTSLVNHDKMATNDTSKTLYMFNSILCRAQYYYYYNSNCLECVRIMVNTKVQSENRNSCIDGETAEYEMVKHI